MLGAGFNFYKSIFPFVVSSKFVFKNYKSVPVFNFLEISLDLKNKFVVPEVAFWVLYSLNFKKSYVSSFFRKKFMYGKGFITRISSMMSKKIGSFRQMLAVLEEVQEKMIPFTQEIMLMRSFPKKNPKILRTFKFDIVSYDDVKYLQLIILSSRYWNTYNFRLTFSIHFVSGEHARFFLQNLHLPVL